MKYAIMLCVIVMLEVVSPSFGEFSDLKEKFKDSVDFVKETYQGSKDFVKEAYEGSKDMLRAYNDMREANWVGSDKYFHARGNYEAAQRGPGGEWAAEVISNTREYIQGVDKPDSVADQVANRWGRNGGDPNEYRPEGLPEKY